MSSDELERIRVEMLDHVNRARALGRDCGGTFHHPLPALARDARLDAAAQAHTEEMARVHRLDHRSLDGQSPFDRITAAGYAFRAAAENIASGSQRVADTLAQWLNSPGHCAHVMGAAYLHLGIGHARAADGTGYWTIAFGNPW